MSEATIHRAPSPMDVGVGLWSMRSTSASPACFPVLYQELQDDARLAEALGFHSLWLSEHHFWYDGWCPSLLVAGAAVLGATSTLVLGTGVFLLPLHDPARIAVAGSTLDRLAPGRTELAIGLGYRDEEFDSLGRSRRTRGRDTDRALTFLTQEWADAGPNLWVGGIADRALRRASEHDLSLFLPSSMDHAQVREVVERARERADRDQRTMGRVGVLKSTWLTDGSARSEERARHALSEQTREYGGSWWLLREQLGFAAPALLDGQMRRSAETAIVGPPDAVVEELQHLRELGVNLVVLHVASDQSRPAYREIMSALSTDVLPALP